MLWVLVLLVAAGLGLAGALAGGTLRVRWSWADAGAIALALLMGLSAGYAVDRRPAINLAWEWGGIVLAYLLVRNLPRTRGESTALAGALAATAVAVAVYGLYQAGVETPELQRRFLANKAETFRLMGVEPGTPAAASLENRLLHSTEPYSTFALANSLAGFLVGPLVLMLAAAWNNLTNRDGRGSRAATLALAVPPIAAVVICLVLTKSRSAWIGLAVALLVLAWRERKRVRPRTLALAAVGAGVVVAALVAAGLATGRLDALVFTQSNKSFRYRLEYWTGTWRAITESPKAFWQGYGPGNFAAAYLRHKLPEASEEIKDPHNFALETWASAGLWAVVALASAVAIGLWNAFGPARRKAGEAEPQKPDALWNAPDAPPASPGWVLACAGTGWLAVLLVGDVNLFVPGLFERWAILGVSWGLAVACGLPLWRRRPLDPAALGAAALAVLINLTAAGGISIPAVALALWSALALAMNLRDDRPCGVLRGAGGRVPAFALTAVWVALLGTFVGAVGPYWRCSAAMAKAEDALNARTPDYASAEAYYERAKDADRFSSRPWRAMAALDYRVWMEQGAKPNDFHWRKIPIEMFKAVDPPRAPDAWAVHLERAQYMSLVLRHVASSLSPIDLTKYRANVVESSRKASRLYPTNASLRARLAEASADIGMTADALKEGKAALELDKATPHADKKLTPAVRTWLEGKIPEWEKSVPRAQGGATTKPKAPTGAK